MLQNHVESNPKIEITVHIDETAHFIDAECYCLLVSIINEFRKRGCEITFSQTDWSHDKFTYASRINFFKNLNIPYQENFTRHPNKGRFIEITHIPFDHLTITDGTQELIKSTFELNEDQMNNIIFVIDELTCNLGRHSKSFNGGYIYGQKYPNNDTLELIIVDCGQGIHESLKVAYPQNDNVTSLIESMNYSVTSGDGRGHGLYFVSELVKRNSGSLELFSGNNRILVDRNGARVRNYNYFFKGTLIKIVFNLKNVLALEEILKELRYTLTTKQNEQRTQNFT